MRNGTHSLIGLLRKYVAIWRRRESWSIGTVGEEIIAAHERIGGVEVSGIRFEPHTMDAYDRQRINGERIARWLDDETKDNNLLPANFAQSILAALPVDLRLACLDEFLEPLGMAANLVVVAGQLNPAELVKAVAREGGEATAALASLVDAAAPDELRKAQQEITEAIAALATALGCVESALQSIPTKNR